MTACRCSWLAGLLLSLTAAPVAAEELYWIYTVRPGDTIWDLTARHTTSVMHWKRIQRVNGLPDRPARGMVPGTRLKFPLDILKHQPATATIRSIFGTAELVRMPGDTVAVVAGMEVGSGDRLLVAESGNVTVQFADDSELLVTGGSEVVFDSLSAWGETGMVDTRIRLQSGAVDTRVKSRKGPGSRYEITTPAAVAAVRGTDFRVSAESASPVTRSEVLEGNVEVNAGGMRRNVAQNFGVVAESGKPPSQPIPLLPPPDLAPQSARLERVPLQFAWLPVETAQGYRYQVSADAAFDRLLANRTSDAAQGALDDLPNGDYVLRVRAIDSNGLEGRNATRRFTVAAHPAPPAPATLHNGSVTNSPDAVFAWSPRDGVRHYHFQLATDPDFTELRAEETAIDGVEFVMSTPLEPAQYYWRVASVDATSHRGPWSDAASFTYRPLPAPPSFRQAEIRRWEIDFHWTDTGEGYRYRFQLAEDADFLETLVDETVSETRVTTYNPGPDRYFIRVRAMDANGVAGRWSDSEKFEIAGKPWQAILPGLLLIF